MSEFGFTPFAAGVGVQLGFGISYSLYISGQNTLSSNQNAELFVIGRNGVNIPTTGAAYINSVGMYSSIPYSPLTLTSATCLYVNNTNVVPGSGC